MSRPQKIIPPVKGDFNSILTSVAMGRGVGKRAAIRLARSKAGPQPKLMQPKPPKS